MESIINGPDWGISAFMVEIKDEGRHYLVGFWEDGEVIIEDETRQDAFQVHTPSVEDWKRLRLIAGRAIKKLEKDEA